MVWLQERKDFAWTGIFQIENHVEIGTINADSHVDVDYPVADCQGKGCYMIDNLPIAYSCPGATFAGYEDDETVLNWHLEAPGEEEAAKRANKKSVSSSQS